jgi:hypothetical protein
VLKGAARLLFCKGVRPLLCVGNEPFNPFLKKAAKGPSHVYAGNAKSYAFAVSPFEVHTLPIPSIFSLQIAFGIEPIYCIYVIMHDKCPTGWAAYKLIGPYSTQLLSPSSFLLLLLLLLPNRS